ncbi:c-type cytochrome [Pigmentiphaga aceris]|uniref:C-type cytochrome n=1 Tax=Pigmentiphaga aceris TaxID=1940612 RepID=A0A5C0AVP8_9BURK|nr:c-type cytochrome [Pigmentiphaga aceris]QEI05776.1 c-type cytochrome [Pigmentiphaga aceris]
MMLRRTTESPDMPEHQAPGQGGRNLTLLLIILFVPAVVVLVAVTMVMGRAWMDGLAVRAVAVTAPQMVDTGPAVGVGPAPQTGRQADAPGSQQAATPTSPINTVTSPTAEVMRLATDFSPARPAWEGALAAGTADEGQQIVDVGGPGLVACSSCHGKAGIAPAGSPFPDLAGKQAEYIAKQLMDFRAGTRNHAIMTPIARAMKDSDVGAVAKYFGGLPLRPAPVRATGPARGEALDRIGDMALGLPACANCHGMGGAGIGPLLPSLAGEPAEYLIAQLHAFRAGSRSNDDGGVMRGFAKRLSETDIRALAEFYAATKSGQR